MGVVDAVVHANELHNFFMDCDFDSNGIGVEQLNGYVENFSMTEMKDHFLERDLPKDLPAALDDHEEGEFWKGAFEKEMGMVKKFNVLGKKKPIDEVRRDGTQITPTKLVFDRKKAVDMTTRKTVMSKHKVRFCAMEFKRERGKLTHAPQVRLTSMKMLLAFGHSVGMEFCGIDFSSAFLHGKATYPMMLIMPKGMKEYDKRGIELLIELIGNLYGTTTAAKIWFELLQDWLRANGWRQFKCDKCVWVMEKHTIPCYIWIHTDDTGMMANDRRLITYLVECMRKDFELTGPDTLSRMIGMNIEQRGAFLIIEGKNWMYDRLKRYGYVNTDGSLKEELALSTPRRMNAKFDPDSPPADNIGITWEKIGGNTWCATMYHPEIQYAALECSKHMQRATAQVDGWSDDILRYLVGAFDMVLTCKRGDTIPLQIFDHVTENEPMGVYDASWNMPKSTSCVQVYSFGMLVTSLSITQSTPATSSTDAEISGQHRCAKELMFARMFSAECVGVDVRRLPPSEIYGDSVNALKFGQEGRANSRMKHTPLELGWTNAMVQQLHFDLKSVRTDENSADIGTKALPAKSFDKHRAKMGMRRM